MPAIPYLAESSDVRLVQAPGSGPDWLIWLGVRGKAAGQPRWTCAGQNLAAAGQLRPVLNAAELQKDARGQAFTGWFRVTPPVHAAASFDLQCAVDGKTAGLRLRHPAHPLPDDPAVLIGSCHRAATNLNNTLVASVGRLTSLIKREGQCQGPDLSLLLGDQVYMDIAGTGVAYWENYPDTDAGLKARLARHYTEAWFAASQSQTRVDDHGFGAVLKAGPLLCMADDHEFWNNHPWQFAAAANTWTLAGRQRWQRAAQELFEAYQQPPPALHSPHWCQQANLGWVQVFCLDTRLQRTRNQAASAAGIAQLRQWVAALRPDSIAVVAAGQSFFRRQTGGFARRFIDAELPDFDDYQDIVTVLMKIPRPLLCVTGDVHFARLLRAQRRNGMAVVEVISSPIALWEGAPRSEGATAADIELAPELRQHLAHHPDALPVGQGRTHSAANQLCLLRFDRAAGKPRVVVTYQRWLADGQPLPQHHESITL